MTTFFNNWMWQPPVGWQRITTVDLHTGGEPLRVLTSGLPQIEGRTVLEKRRFFREHYDFIRTGILWEPRGHADMYGAVLTPSEDADFDVFFLHNEGYSTMCGHAIIALTKLVLETGLITKDSNPARLTINAPAGKIEASAAFEDGVVYSASFQNVPSFLYLRDEHIQIPGIGKVRFDIAYGGAFYAIVEAASVGIELIPKSAAALIELGRKIKRAITDYLPIKHPFEEDLSFLYGTIFTGPALVSGHHSRNVCIFADGELDRSATGTGISARVALHYAKRELRLHQSITIESVLGTMMTVKAIKQTRYGPYEAVIPEVSGTASITGKNEFFFDPEDSLRTGFILR